MNGLRDSAHAELGPALSVANLSKAYSTRLVRRVSRVGVLDLSFQVERGEVFGYLGPNGSGKTTTLKILVGLLWPDAGSITILGHSHEVPEWRYQVGFLPEHPYFYDYLTPIEYLDFVGRLFGMPAARRRERAGELLERLGLDRARNVSVRRFSKGMVQRLGLAQALLNDPELVFLDEPMSGLDPMGRREVRDLIQQMRSEGKTVFFSTHILSDAEALCDRVGVIHQGELRGVGAVAELTSGKQGKVEIIFCAPRVPAGLTSLGAEARVSGAMVNAVLPEEQQDAALEVLRRERLKLISLTPVRSSLEEYYIQKLRPTEGREEGEEERKGVGA